MCVQLRRAVAFLAYAPARLLGIHRFRGSIAASPIGSAEMLKLALFFLLVGIVAGLLGFTGVAGAAVGIAKAIFYLGVGLFLLFLLLIAIGVKRIT